MRRREFITLISGTTAAWPLAARAQQPPVRRIGVVVPATADDPDFQAWIGAFLQGLGWTIGNNVKLEIRWVGGNADDIRRHATELVALTPDIILAHGASTASRILQATHTVPIVFPVVFDPVGAGLVDSLARPGGNVTGFMPSEYSIGGKWLKLLKQISPKVTRVAVIRDTTTPTGAAMFGVIQAAASPLGLEVTALNMRDAGEIQRGITEFVRSPNAVVRAHRATTLPPRHPKRVQKGDELAPPHSITSSTLASTAGGIARPSVFAVLRLIASSAISARSC